MVTLFGMFDVTDFTMQIITVDAIFPNIKFSTMGTLNFKEQVRIRDEYRILCIRRTQSTRFYPNRSLRYLVKPEIASCIEIDKFLVRLFCHLSGRAAIENATGKTLERQGSFIIYRIPDVDRSHFFMSPCNPTCFVCVHGWLFAKLPLLSRCAFEYWCALSMHIESERI